jgi:hypothetical protein
LTCGPRAAQEAHRTVGNSFAEGSLDEPSFHAQGETEMLRKVAGLTGGFVMLVAALAILPQRGKADDVDKVLVVNGPKKPVPVTGNVALAGPVDVNVTNTPSVNVTNTPSVNVTNTPNVNVTNTPNVNVTGLPAVQLAAGTSVGLAPGTVVGAVDANAHQAVQKLDQFTIPANITSLVVTAYTVPAGKRFVLEDFSGSALVPTGQKVTIAGIVANGASQAMEAVPSFVGPAGGGFDTFVWGRLARVYAEPSTNVQVVVGRNPNADTADVFYALSGYLVDL